MSGKISTDELRNLISSLNDAGMDELAEKINKRLEKGQKLSRSMVKQLEAVRKAENKAYQEKLKMVKSMEAQEHRLLDYQKTKLKQLREELAVMDKNAKAYDKLTESTDKNEKSTKKFNETHSKTINEIRKAPETIARYTSALGILDGILSGFEALYNNWFRLQEITTRSMGELAMRTGATATQLANFDQHANRLRETFASLGGSADGIAESLQFVGEAAIALRTDMSGMSQEFEMSLVAVQRGLGMSADQAAQIVRTLESGVEGGNESLADFTIGIREFAETIGANASTMAQDYLDARDSLVLFGEDGGEAFRRTATFANHLGFETRRILDMARRFDTFGQASEHINQLNAMFGTTISSFEMMQEEDPVRRIEMITNAIRDQGLSWDNMGRHQRMALAQTMGVSETEAARLMNGESMAQIQEEQAQRQREQEALAGRQARVQETILSIIERTTTLFASWRRYFEQIINDVSEALDPIFSAIHESAEGTMIALRQWIQEIVANPRFQTTIRDIADWIRRLPEHIEAFLPTWEQIEKKATEMWPTIQQIGSTLMTIFNWVTENPEAVGVALGVGAAAMLLSNLTGVAALFSPGGLLLAGVAAFALAIADSSANLSRTMDDMNSIHGNASSGMATKSERARLGYNATTAANYLGSNAMGRGQTSAFGRGTSQLLARGAQFFGAEDLSQEIMDNLARDELVGSGNYRELSRQALLGNMSVSRVAMNILDGVRSNPDNEVLVRRSFGLSSSEDLTEGLLRELTNMSMEINPPDLSGVVSSPSAEDSAVASAPVTTRTSERSSPTPSGSAGSTEVIVKSIEMNAVPVGRVMVEVTRR